MVSDINEVKRVQNTILKMLSSFQIFNSKDQIQYQNLLLQNQNSQDIQLLKKNNLIYLLKLLQLNTCIIDQSLLLKIPTQFIQDLQYEEQAAVIVEQNFYQRFQNNVKYVSISPTYNLIFLLFNYYGKLISAQEVLKQLAETIQIQECDIKISTDINQYRLLYQTNIELEANKPFQSVEDVKINYYFNDQLGYRLNLLVSSKHQYIKQTLQTNQFSSLMINILNMCLLIKQSNFEDLHGVMRTFQKELLYVKRYQEYLETFKTIALTDTSNKEQLKKNYDKINAFVMNDKRLTLINDQELQKRLIMALRIFIKDYDSKFNKTDNIDQKTHFNLIRPSDICQAIINQYNYQNIQVVTKANYYDLQTNIQVFLSTLLVSVKLLLSHEFNVIAYSQYQLTDVMKSVDMFDIFVKELLLMTPKRYKYILTPEQFIICYAMASTNLHKLNAMQILTKVQSYDTQNHIYLKQLNQQQKQLYEIIEQFKQIDINNMGDQNQQQDISQSQMVIKYLSVNKVESLISDSKHIIDSIKQTHEDEISRIRKQIFDQIGILDAKLYQIEKKFNITKGKKKKPGKININSSIELSQLNNILFYEFNKYKIMFLSKEDKSQLKLTISPQKDKQEIEQSESKEESHDKLEQFGRFNDEYFDIFKPEFNKYKIMLTKQVVSPYQNMFNEINPEVQLFMQQFEQEFNKYKLMLTANAKVFNDVLTNVKKQLGFEIEFDKYDLENWRK